MMQCWIARDRGAGSWEGAFAKYLSLEKVRAMKALAKEDKLTNSTITLCRTQTSAPPHIYV